MAIKFISKTDERWGTGATFLLASATTIVQPWTNIVAGVQDFGGNRALFPRPNRVDLCACFWLGWSSFNLVRGLLWSGPSMSTLVLLKWFHSVTRNRLIHVYLFNIIHNPCIVFQIDCNIPVLSETFWLFYSLCSNSFKSFYLSSKASGPAFSVKSQLPAQ